MLATEIIVFDDAANQPFEVVALSGKCSDDFTAQEIDAVVEVETDAGEDDLRAELRRDGQVVPREAELAEQAGKLILGVCNGFQILIKSGVLLPDKAAEPIATLTLNDSGKFEDRWVRLAVTPNNCVKSASDNGARWVLIVLSRMARAASFSSQLRSSEMKIFGNWPLGC